MTQDPRPAPPEPEPDMDLLAAIGRVGPPDPGVLDAAREALWSAVAQEMLEMPSSAAEEPGTRTTSAGEPGTRTAGEQRPCYREQPGS